MTEPHSPVSIAPPLRRDAWVAGVDGCRAGWVAVLLPMEAGEAPRVRVAATFMEILQFPEAPARIAVDMPIGLADKVGPGGRLCDIEVRSRLGKRQSSVFTVPARAAVIDSDYRHACEIALAYSEPPRKISKQCFHLFPKIREIDDVITPALQERLFECHPELAFWAMNGQRPLDEPKKVKSRPHGPGLALRRRLLASGGMPALLLDEHIILPKGVAADDILDAAACAWTARRVSLGKALRLPETPPVDGRGLRMEIWA
jgi:predicted RNase H-like nuclease